MSKKTKRQPIPAREKPVIFNWLDLVTLQQETVKEILGKQLLVRELAKSNEETITTNKELFASISGLNKSYTDLADECRVVALTHAVDTKKVKIGDTEVEITTHFRDGTVIDDERLDYITIGSNYLGIQEKLAYIASTAYLDIFMSMKLDTTSPEYQDMKKIEEGNPNARK